MHELTGQLKQKAQDLGFDLCGVCPAVSPAGVTHLQDWLAAGYAGQMHYLQDRQSAYQHPRHVLDGVRSLLMLGTNYRTADPATPQPGQARISRYAWGSDYHDLIHHRLKQLVAWLREAQPQATARGVVDTAPLLEGEFAQLAGLGWIGKNTLLLNRHQGSWFFLAALLTDLQLEYDQPHQTDHCGTCRACLDACPTDAFVEPYVLDSRKCISYLTIELRDPLPSQLREGIGDWLFGCDICQDVCPWNRQAPASPQQEFRPRPGANPVDLAELFQLDDAAFRQRFRRTPLWRAKRRGILRNAAIVLGNHRAPESIPALLRGLEDNEPLIRGAAAWALGRIGGNEPQNALAARLTQETDPTVRAEIESAMTASAP